MLKVHRNVKENLQKFSFFLTTNGVGTVYDINSANYYYYEQKGKGRYHK